MIDAERTFKCKWPKVKFNEISGLLQFFLIICSQECYWISWRDFQNAVKCNYLLIIDMIVLENTFLKNQISNNVTFLSFLCNQRTFWTFADASFSLKLIYIFPENLNSLSENWSFWNKQLFFSIFPMSTTLSHICEHVQLQCSSKFDRGNSSQNMGGAWGSLKCCQKYLSRSSFDSKVAGYKPASLQLY